MTFSCCDSRFAEAHAYTPQGYGLGTCPAADPTATHWAAFRDAGLDGAASGREGRRHGVLGVVDEDEQVIDPGQPRYPPYRVGATYRGEVERHR